MSDETDQSTAQRQALYQNAPQALLGENWGTRIQDAATGVRKDTGVQALAETIAEFLATGEIRTWDTVKIISNVQGAPILQLVDAGGASTGVQVVNNQTGEQAQLGPGLQSQGIVASELVPAAYYFVLSSIANQLFSNTGGGTGPNGVTGYVPGTVPGGAQLVGGGPGTGAPPQSGLINTGGAGAGTGWQPINGPNGLGYPFVTGALGKMLLDWFLAGGPGSEFSAGCGISIDADGVISLNTSIFGDGFSVGDCTVSLIFGCGLTVDGDNVISVDASTLAGDGIGTSGTCTLKVNVDNSTIEINSDTLRVKDGGITTAKIANNAVTSAKTSGTTETTDVVTAVTCSGGTLSVTTHSWTFTNGLRTA